MLQNSAEQVGAPLFHADVLLQVLVGDNGLIDAAQIAVAGNVRDDDVELHRNVAVVVDRRLHFDVHADIDVGELRADQRADTGGCDACAWREGACRDGNLGPDLEHCLFTVDGANLRVLEHAGVGVGEQHVQCGRADRDAEIGGVQVAKIVQREGSGARARCRSNSRRGSRRRCRGCRRSRGLQLHADRAGKLQTDVAQQVLIDFKDGDVDDDLRLGLIEIVDDLLRQQQLIRCAAHDDGALAGNGLHLDRSIHQVADRIQDFVQVVGHRNVAEVEGLDGLLFQLGSFLTRVGGNKNRVPGDWTPEGLRHERDAPESVVERHPVQIDRNALRGIVRVEQHVDSGNFADGLINHLAVRDHVDGDRFLGQRLQLQRSSQTAELLRRLLRSDGGLVGV